MPKGDKYINMISYLKNSNKDHITMTFQEFEIINGDSLPESCYYNRTTWGNTLGHSVAHAWLQAGYKVENVNLEKNIVTFVKNRDGLY